MCPNQWQLTMPQLETVFRDHTQPFTVRASALEALSLVAPVRPTTATEPEEHKADAREKVRHVVELLGSFLPPPPGSFLCCTRRTLAFISKLAGTDHE
jgi:hypothetical protein